MADAQYFVEENLEGDAKEVTSPSGRYRLVIRTYRTLPGRWNYTRGTVVRISDGTTVCDIQRNYSVFHHSFVTKDDREYLISGRAYMSQTIVDLDRSREYELGTEGFCWAACYLSPDGNTLAVDGCIWACPYEYRFFDFTDPSRGWRELPIADVDVLEDPSSLAKPRWLDATTIECSQLDRNGAPQERTRLRRRDDTMVVEGHWLSGAEQQRREEEARAEIEQAMWWQEFRSNEPMYPRLREGMRALQLPCDMLDWMPSSPCLKLYIRRARAVDLTWNVAARTLTLQLYTPTDDRDREVSFEHSVAGVDACLDMLASIYGR